MGIKGLFKHLFLIAFVVSLSACGGGESSSGETQTIIEEQKSPTTNLVFADQTLADCVQSLIDFQGYILVEQITQLTCSGLSITDIEGIQKLFNLETLDLSSNQIRDITPIAELKNLKVLNLSDNNIQITTPIQELPALEQLDLSENISIICGVGYDQLKEKFNDLPACIDGQGEQSIEDIFNGKDLQSCIEQTVQEIKDKYKTETIYPEQITQLKCVKQDISSIEGIDQLENLRELDLSQNNISDITALQNLTQLKKVLLGQNQITDTQPLKSSIYMQELRLDNNQLTDITPIQILTALKQLHLTNNSIRDLTPIQGMTELLELRISNNRIIDIDALANLKKLSSLWIQGNQIAKIDAIAQIPNLDQLWISNNWLTDLTPLQSQTQLRWLHLDGTEVQDLNPLNSLTQLEWLQLNNTRVEDIRAIYPLTKLNWLHLKGNNTIPCSQLDHMEEIITAENIDRPETCNQPQEQTGTPISTIEFQDQALRDCVYDTAAAEAEEDIINTDQLNSLTCLGNENIQITDINPLLEEFPELQGIDLTGNDHISCEQLEYLEEKVGAEALSRSESCNSAPTISADAEQTVIAGEQTTIATEVTDEDQLTYSWQQAVGETVRLINADTQTPSFTAPEQEQTLEFTLTVTDPYGLSATQTINIIVTGALLGTKENPFLVTNYEDLKKVGTGIDGWNLDSHYLQTADIDATPSATENEIDGQYLGFRPIGTEETPFTGGYDGGGFTIDGLMINRPDESNVALFGRAQDIELSNINMTDIEVIGDTSVSGLVGYLYSRNKENILRNTMVLGKVTGNTYVGCAFGLSAGVSIIIDHIASDCLVAGSVAIGGIGGYVSNVNTFVNNSSSLGGIDGGITKIGGIIGYSEGQSLEVKNSYSSSQIVVNEEFTNYLGGIVGWSRAAVNIDNSYYRGSIEVNSPEMMVSHIGGLFGSIYSTANIYNSFSVAEISISAESVWQVGGLFGGAYAGNLELLDSHADTKILIENNSTTNQLIGGVAGQVASSEILANNSYSSGSITINQNTNSRNDYIGGFIGALHSEGGILNSFANVDVGVESGGENISTRIGGFIGKSLNANLKQVYSTGQVTCNNCSIVGGVVGDFQGGMSNSYARGNVTGNSQVGGLVGQMQHSEGDDETPATYSSIINSYSTGQVTLQNEELEPVDFGGLVGASTSELNTVSNSFWDIETSGMQESAGGEPKTSDELKTTTTFTNAGWDFDQTWMILSEGYTYPRLAWNTIEVNSWSDLHNMRNNMHANYVLTRDLLTSDPDYAELAGSDANDGKGWEPVGTDANPFMGTFDGGGFTIDGLTINRPEESQVGLFGYALNSNFKNINIDNASIKAHGYVAGIVGQATNSYEPFTIINSSLSGEILGQESEYSASYCAGMVGMVASGSGAAIVNNKFNGDISCDLLSGGIIGQFGGPELLIKDSNFEGEIVAQMQLGGVLGAFSGVELRADNIYSSGQIITRNEGQGFEVGGLIGGIHTIDIFELINSRSAMNISVHLDGVNGDGLEGSKIGGLIGALGAMTLPQYSSISQSYSSGNITVDGDADQVGGLVGFVGAAYSYVNDSYATGNVTASGSGSFIGGVFGFYQSGLGYVANAYATGNIQASNANYVGGFSGFLSGAAIVYDSFYNGAVSGGDYTGGLIGRSGMIEVENSYALGTVQGSSMVGGLIGEVESYESKVRKSFADNIVIGIEKTGGLVGNFSGSIDDSYANGDVAGNSQVGGLVGQINYQEEIGDNPAYYSAINSSYATGLVQLQDEGLEPIDFGGLIGASTHELNAVTNSFWDIETSGQQASVGGTGLMTYDMQNQYTFESAGWDYYSIWGQEQNQYPYHLEQDGSEFIEFQSGSYSGAFSWDCYGDENDGSTAITFDLTETNGFITGTASYLGGTAKISLGNYDKHTGAFTLRIPKTATNVANVFYGTFDPENLGEIISGQTIYGEDGSGNGCKAYDGAVHTIILN